MSTAVVWYDTPEAAHAAFWASVPGVDLEGATFGGETASGEEVELSSEQVVAGIRAGGVWGFSDGERLHVWIGDAPMPTLVHFFAHELAHLYGMDAPPIQAEEEAWAEKVGEIAAEAYTLASSATAWVPA